MWEQSREDSERGRTHISKAVCKRKNAIFGPTPGFSISEQSSSTVFGTSESNSSHRHTACRIYHFPVGHQLRGGQEGGVRTNCVLRRQKPTLLMESAMTSSPVASRASRLSVVPSAARSLSTATSVTSSLVCDETTRETSAANSLFRSCKEKRDDGGRYRVLRGNRRSVEKPVIRANAMMCVTHPRIHLLPLDCAATHYFH